MVVLHGGLHPHIILSGTILVTFDPLSIVAHNAKVGKLRDC
jgi:hypothetical protein